MIVPDIEPGRAGRPWAPDARALDLIGDAWTLLIVRELSHGPRRRVELEQTMSVMSSGALSSRLRDMGAARLITRRRFNELPPRVVFELTSAGRELVPIVGAVARWAQRWSWGEPSPGERVDLPAFFRLLPDLVGGDLGGRGEVELVVQTQTVEDVHAVTLSEAGIAVAHERANGSAAQIAGPESAWVAAIADRVPTGSRPSERLAISGDRALAQIVLRALAGPRQISH
jgi:DNA-binding HxlR family transcriptional regulator